MHARETTVFLTESSKKALVEGLGEHPKLLERSKEGQSKLGSGFYIETHTHTCMYI